MLSYIIYNDYIRWNTFLCVLVTKRYKVILVITFVKDSKDGKMSLIIDSVEIYGTKHIQMQINGICTEENVKIQIYKNNKKIYDEKYHYDSKNKEVDISLPLPGYGSYKVTCKVGNKKLYDQAFRISFLGQLKKRIHELYINRSRLEYAENAGETKKFIIEKCIVYGSLRPQLCIKGAFDSNDYKLKVYKNKKVIFEGKANQVREDVKHLLSSSSIKKNGFEYMVRLPLFSSKIYFVIERKGEVVYKRRLDNNLCIKMYKKIHNYLKLGGKAIRFLWKKHHFLVPPKMIPYYYRKLKEKIAFSDSNMNFLDPFNPKEYGEWLTLHEHIDEVKPMKYNPLISIVTPVYNVDEEYLTACLDSVLEQSYENWEFCLADDCSPDENVRKVLKRYEKKDSRIKVVYRKKNGRISEATNSALEIAKGEYIGLLDNDDTLTKDALYEVVKALNENKKIDLIYSDEDKINLKGERCDPYFKSDWSPDTFMSNNYLCHFTVMRKSILDKIGGERSEYDGAQDYDLFLRFTEKAKVIHHIPKILYHWRIIPGSTSETISAKHYALEAGKKALESALERRKIKGSVESNGDGTYIIHYAITNPKVSIIIPTRDYASTLETCLTSIYEKSTYQNFEVIIVDNGSKENATFTLFDTYKEKHDNFKVLRLDCEFNYSYINNEAVKIATGEYVLLLNNDTEIITEDWIEKMVMYASLSHAGTVGVKLYYPDNTIQHGGMVMGVHGVAGHAYLNYGKDFGGYFGKLKAPCNYGGNTAACLMVSKKKYEEVGGLDEKLKVNYNDVDFNLKMTDKGYYNIFLPQVELYHYESKSRGLDISKEKYEQTQKEAMYIRKKWGNQIMMDPFYNPNYSLNEVYKLEK